MNAVRIYVGYGYQLYDGRHVVVESFDALKGWVCWELDRTTGHPLVGARMIRARHADFAKELPESRRMAGGTT